MASELLGRTACPECGFAHAHIKIKTDKEGANPYRHCPDCGAQYFTRSAVQAANLRAQCRPEKGAGDVKVPEPVLTPPEPVEIPPKPAKRGFKFGSIA
jgi:predicted RNA-binding Zn-ribbon protein involved in translation (DUF1610 family)